MHLTLTHQHLYDLKNAADAGNVCDLINAFSSLKIRQVSVIKKYHDLLLFYLAHPQSREVYKVANIELKRICKIIENSKNVKDQVALMNSGIAGTEICCSFSSTIVQWLMDTFPGMITLESGDASPETTRNIFQALLPGIEYEKISQGELNLNSRIKTLTQFQQPGEQLSWLLGILKDSSLSALLKEELFRLLKVFIRWKPNDELFNGGFLHLPIKKIFYQEDLIKKVDPMLVLEQKIKVPVLLSISKKNELLDVMKASLSLQCRETDPVTYADEKELHLFDMGRGLQIALVGMVKERRLSLETYIGYMAFKNGIPVSYGGGWIWGHRCKIGVNIFPPFRSGESALLFCQVLRVYYQYYKISHFVVKPYQFGKGNPEGLNSGAFWFYYKLGFRPENKKIFEEAAAEWMEINKKYKHRTPVKVLQHFASCNMEWITGKKTVPDFDAAKVSLAVSKYIIDTYNSNRKDAVEICVKSVKKYFPVKLLHPCSPGRQMVLENWSLLLGLLNDFPSWSPVEKKAMIQLIQLKQSGRERDYVLHLQKHRHLWRTLEKIIKC
jgi:hypothetical protein